MVASPLPRWEDLERAAALFRALGDASRLSLIFRLEGGGRCVGELADEGRVKLSTLSQQLRVLHAERLVTRRREGKHVRYALTDEHVRALVRAALAHAEELSPAMHLRALPDVDRDGIRFTEPTPRRLPTEDTAHESERASSKRPRLETRPRKERKKGTRP